MCLLCSARSSMAAETVLAETGLMSMVFIVILPQHVDYWGAETKTALANHWTTLLTGTIHSASLFCSDLQFFLQNQVFTHEAGIAATSSSECSRGFIFDTYGVSFAFIHNHIRVLSIVIDGPLE